MYNFLKIGAVIVTGRLLQPRFKGLLALIAFWFIVRFLHAEYLSYVSLSGDTQHLILASLIKIALYLQAFLVYVFSVERRLLQRSASEIEARQLHSREAGTDDGFDFLRQKKKLVSPTEQLLKKK